MHRTDAPGATAGNLFTEGDPAIPIEATEVSDSWLNDVQENLCGAIEGAGLVLSKGDYTQLLGAMLRVLSIIPMAILEDRKAAGTNGGTYTAGGWRTRDLNTITQTVAGIVTLGPATGVLANQFQLPAGMWLVHGSAVMLHTDYHQARLRNITSGTTAIPGSTEQVTGYGVSSDATGSRSSIIGIVTLDAPAVFEVQHVGNVTVPDLGFGAAMAQGESNVYTRLIVTKMR